MTSCRLYGSIGAVEGAMLFTGAVRVNLSAGAHKLSAAPNVAACNPNKNIDTRREEGSSCGGATVFSVSM
jgi:hypothetical protein